MPEPAFFVCDVTRSGAIPVRGPGSTDLGELITVLFSPRAKMPLPWPDPEARRSRGDRESVRWKDRGRGKASSRRAVGSSALASPLVCA
jgi:hypothetical protein